VLKRRASHGRYALLLAIAVYLLLSSILSYHLHAPTILARHLDPSQFQLDDHRWQIREIARLIPTDAVAVAQNELLSYVSQRRRIYEIPMIPDYRQADYLIADTTRLYYQVHRGLWEGFLSSGYFETIYAQDGYLVAQRRSPAHRLNIEFENNLSLVGYTIIPSNTLQGGMTLRPILEWQAGVPLTMRYATGVRLVDEQGHVWAEDAREPQAGRLPTTAWVVGKSIGDQYKLPLPPTMPAGKYNLEACVSHTETMETKCTPGLTALEIEKDKRSYTASELQIENRLYVDLGEMRFLGWKQMAGEIRPGEVWQVGLYWRARSKPQGDYVVVIQLQDAEGSVIAESGRPAKGTYPTLEWHAGEVLLDWHDIVIPTYTPTGT